MFRCETWCRPGGSGRLVAAALCGLLTAALCGLLWAAPASAQARVTYDHSACRAVRGEGPRSPDCFREATVWLRAGQPFTIEVQNTDTTAFRYEIEGLTPVVEKEAPPDVGPEGVPAFDDTVRVSYTHASRFGGYILRIAPKEGASPQLGRAEVTLTVREPRAVVEFSGGILFTTIRDRRFGARAMPDTTFDMAGGVAAIDTVQVVVGEDDDDREFPDIGFATLVSVHHTRHVPSLALVSGLGVDTDGNAQYYLGGALRLGDVAQLNAGWVRGRVRMLPVGVEEGDRIRDANLLSNLATRGESGFYVGLSFVGIGGGKSAFEKPFAGAGGGGGGS